MRIVRPPFLPSPAQQAMGEVVTSRLLLYVASPMVRFIPVDPPSLPERWQERKYLIALRLFGFLPFGRQTINVSVPSRSRDSIELRDNGCGSLIQKWDHRIIIRSGAGGTIYTDRVDIDAGMLTPFVWCFAWLFYRHRQRRWKKLARNDFNYKGR